MPRSGELPIPGARIPDCRQRIDPDGDRCRKADGRESTYSERAFNQALRQIQLPADFVRVMSSNFGMREGMISDFVAFSVLTL